MPRKAKLEAETKSLELETKTTAAVSAAPRGAKTAAIKAALKVHSTKGPKQIAELLQADGWDIKAQLVSVVKSAQKAKQKPKAVAVAAPVVAGGPVVVPKDAVSLALLQKAKKLVAQLGSLKEAKQAMDALAQLMD